MEIEDKTRFPSMKEDDRNLLRRMEDLYIESEDEKVGHRLSYLSELYLRKYGEDYRD